MTEVVLLPEAEEDLWQAVAFYARERPGLGTEFLREFEDLTELLSENPHLGSPTGDGPRKLIMRRFPYTVIYRLEEERALILA